MSDTTDLEGAIATAIATVGVNAILKLIASGLSSTPAASVPYDIRIQVQGILFPNGLQLESEVEHAKDLAALGGIP